eukprot:scaffold853_cov386-Prasinococcus_capsulatus_cf.AAC.28
MPLQEPVWVFVLPLTATSAPGPNISRCAQSMQSQAPERACRGKALVYVRGLKRGYAARQREGISLRALEYRRSQGGTAPWWVQEICPRKGGPGAVRQSPKTRLLIRRGGAGPRRHEPPPHRSQKRPHMRQNGPEKGASRARPPLPPIR